MCPDLVKRQCCKCKKIEFLLLRVSSSLTILNVLSYKEQIYFIERDIQLMLFICEADSVLTVSSKLYKVNLLCSLNLHQAK